MINVLIFLLLCCHGAPLFGEVMIIGHRGSPCNSPENTLASFKNAIEAGADYIEFDVHLTKDGVPVVTHDPLMARTVNVCSPMSVNCLTLKELQNYDAGVTYHHDFIGEKVPTLEEVFSLAQGQVGMMIEIKTGTASESELAEVVMSVVNEKANGKTPILIGSFSPAVLKRVKELKPAQAIIALAQYDWELRDHLSNDPEYYGLSTKLITEEVVSSLHRQGRKVWVWTVNDEKLKDSLIDKGVDGLITNRPMALRICKETAAAQSPL